MAWDVRVYPAATSMSSANMTYLTVTKVIPYLTSAGYSPRVATAHLVDHGVPDYGYVLISGAGEPEYDGLHQVRVPDEDHFTYSLSFTASKKAYIQSGFQVTKRINERDTASFRCIPGYRPSLRQEVFIDDGAALVFHGLVWSCKSSGGMYAPFFTDVECVGANVVADWISMPLGYSPAQPSALKALLSSIVWHLTQNGISVTLGNTLDGPSVFVSGWSGKKISDCLRELTDLTGYCWSIGSDLVLKMEIPGTTAAAFTIEDGATNCQTIDWTDSSELYANRVIALCGEALPDSWDETVGATGADAVKLNAYLWCWTTLYTASSDPAKAWPSAIVVTEAGGAAVPAASGSAVWGPEFPAPDPRNMWTWDFVNHRLVYDSNEDDVHPAHRRPPFDPTWVIVPITYHCNYPMLIVRPVIDAPIPIVESHATISERQYTTAVALVDQLLASRMRRVRKLSMTTLVHGLNPSDTLYVNIASRGLLGVDFLLESVNVTVTTDNYCLYAVDGTEIGSGLADPIDTYQGSPLLVFRQMLGITGSPSSPVGTTTSSITSIGSPTFLGGSRSTSIVTGAATYLPIPNWVAIVSPGTLTATLRVWLWTRNASISVTARLCEGTDGVTYGTTIATTSAVISQTPTERSTLASLTVGRYYRLEIAADTAGEGVFAIGSLEPV